jgi:hypothetical protein
MVAVRKRRGLGVVQVVLAVRLKNLRKRTETDERVCAAWDATIKEYEGKSRQVHIFLTSLEAKVDERRVVDALQRRHDAQIKYQPDGTMIDA